VLHLIPGDDEPRHLAAQHCPCGPALRDVTLAGGNTRMAMVHNTPTGPVVMAADEAEGDEIPHPSCALQGTKSWTDTSLSASSTQ
jgi:hypothetical protein